MKNHPFFRTKIGFVISVFATQYLIFLTWIAFRVRDFEAMMYSMEKYIILDFAIEKTITVIQAHRLEVFLIGLFFVLHFVSYKKVNLPERISKFRLPFWFIFLLVIILGILFFYDGNPEDFIYFQF